MLRKINVVSLYNINKIDRNRLIVQSTKLVKRNGEKCVQRAKNHYSETHYPFNLVRPYSNDDLPPSSERLLNNVRSWHTCNQRSATLRQISYRSALPFTRGCGRITGRSEVGDPDFEISWTWRETMVSATVCRTEMGVKVTSGVNSFL